MTNINDSDLDLDSIKTWEIMNGRLRIETYSGEVIVISNSNEIQQWLDLLRSEDD
jgi:hypothetical protein